MFIGYIYKITGSCGKCYVGSTVNLNIRIINHNRSDNQCSSKLLEKPLKFEIIRQDEYKLNKTMRLLEQYYLDNAINCVNERRAYISENKKGKYYLKEEYRKYNRDYKEKHREKIKKQNKEYYETHKEEKIEYEKNYRETHKEEIHERQRKYRETHKEEIDEKQRKYREAHRELINEKHRGIYKLKYAIKIECKYCKTLISKRGMSKHHKTKSCLAIQGSLKDAKY
jgi:hypothetical protein